MQLAEQLLNGYGPISCRPVYDFEKTVQVQISLFVSQILEFVSIYMTEALTLVFLQSHFSVTRFTMGLVTTGPVELKNGPLDTFNWYISIALGLLFLFITNK